MATPTSSEGTSGWPEARSESSTSWPSRASWSSVTGRPLHALRTPLITLSRANGSTTPLRLTTVSCICSRVVNRRSHVGHWRRRRMALPSSATRESSTLESVCRQYGQCICGSLLLDGRGGVGAVLGASPGVTGGHAGVVWVSNHNLWSNHMGVTTRYRKGTSDRAGLQEAWELPPRVAPEGRSCRSDEVADHRVGGRGDQPERRRDAPESSREALR